MPDGTQPEKSDFELTTDGWRNDVSGMGDVNRDKNVSTRFVRNPLPTRAEIEALYRSDALAANIVDRIVDEAFRKGFKFQFFGEDTKPIDPELSHSIHARIIRWNRKVKLIKQVKKHLKNARAYGGDVLIMGINDGARAQEDGLTTELPVNEDNVQSFDYLKPFDRFQVELGTSITTDPVSPNYGESEFYRATSIYSVTSLGRSTGANTTPSFNRPNNQIAGKNEESLNQVTFHWTRVIKSDGVELTDEAKLNNLGWGDSIFHRVFEPLKAWGTVMTAAASLVHEGSMPVYGIEGLAKALKAGGSNLIEKRFETMALVKSIYNATFIDAGIETLTRDNPNISGLADIIDRYGIWVAAAARQPLTLLLGVSPGGFGTGEAEGLNWDNVVQSYQEDDGLPVLAQIYKMLFRTPEFKDVPELWDIEFLPLRQMTDLEKADIRLKTAQSDASYIAIGVLSPEEVAQSRFGGEKYDIDTTLDSKAREGMATVQEDEEVQAENAAVEAEEMGGEVEGAEMSAEPDPGAAFTDAEGGVTATDIAKTGTSPAQTAMNGAQITGMAGIVAGVVEGVYPLESAIQMLVIAFPLTEAQARAMLAPTEALKAEKEAETEKNKAEMAANMGGSSPFGAGPNEEASNNTPGSTDDENTGHEDDEGGSGHEDDGNTDHLEEEDGDKKKT